MKYRPFLSLTDEEIKFIMNEIFEPVKIENIRRDRRWNRISCEITTGGWNDGQGENFEITDDIDLELPSFDDCGISAHDFTISDEEAFKWSQYLLAKGCDERLKDNPYLEKDLRDIINRVDFETSICNSNGDHIMKTGSYAAIYNNEIISKTEVHKLITGGLYEKDSRIILTTPDAADTLKGIHPGKSKMKEEEEYER